MGHPLKLKVFQDNTIECYHCPTTHPELSRVLEMKPELQKFEVGGRYWIHHTIPFRSHFNGSLTTQKVEGRPFNYYYHWIFPTTYLQYSGKGFDIGALDIIAVDKIRFRHICFMPIGTPEEKLEQGRKQLAADATIQQDVDRARGCSRPRRPHGADVARVSATRVLALALPARDRRHGSGTTRHEAGGRMREPAKDRYERMKYRSVGKSGLKLPAISLLARGKLSAATAMPMSRANASRAPST